MIALDDVDVLEDEREQMRENLQRKTAFSEALDVDPRMRSRMGLFRAGMDEDGKSEAGSR
jgi:hypothetical protein